MNIWHDIDRSRITPERFTRIVTSALSSTPQLAETTPQSFLGAMMTAAQLGMEPNTPLGQAYLIPYKNKGRLECQFQLGYRGMVELAYRSGEVTIIQAHAVHENDEFEYSFGLEPSLNHSLSHRRCPRSLMQGALSPELRWTTATGMPNSLQPSTLSQSFCSMASPSSPSP